MSETADKILDIAQALIQTRGFNAFSYADIAAEIGIKTASIHYHFPSKGDLGAKLVSRYRTFILNSLKEIETGNEAPIEKLRGYLNLFLDSLEENQICVCVMLASDIQTLPNVVVDEVKMFFIENEEWLSKVFREGRNSNKLKVDGNVDLKARYFMTTVHGALLHARTFKSEERFMTLAQELLNTFTLGQ